MKTLTYTHYEQTIIDSINLDGYGIKTNDLSLHEKIKHVNNIFLAEYGYNISRVGKEKAFAEYLSGLPSCCSVPYMNHAILENAKNNGFKLDREHKEDNFLNNYFKNLSSAFFTLYNNL